MHKASWLNDIKSPSIKFMHANGSAISRSPITIILDVCTRRTSNLTLREQVRDARLRNIMRDKANSYTEAIGGGNYRTMEPFCLFQIAEPQPPLVSLNIHTRTANAPPQASRETVD